MRSRYVELRCHSAYSFGGGVSSPEALVKRAAALGYPALGLTDEADLGGIIRFALEAERQGIRAVVGAELIVDGHPLALLARDAEGYRNLAALVTRARVGRLEGRGGGAGEGARTGRGSSPDLDLRAEGPDLDLEPEHARGGGGRGGRAREGGGGRGIGPGREDEDGNEIGLGIEPGGRGATVAGRPRPPLLRSSARRRRPAPGGRPDGWTGAERARGRPSLTWAELEARAAGVWALTGPATGEIASLVRQRRPEEAAFVLERWKSVFPGRVAVEVQLHRVSGEEAALAAALIALAERAGVPWVVANDPRYLDGGGRLVHDLLTANRAGVDVDTAASWGLLLPNGEWRLKGPEEMGRLWAGREAGLEAAHEIALDCDFRLEWVRPPLPRFRVPAGYDDDRWLRELCYRGARERWGELDARQTAQLEHELGVIERLGFAGFFLVMHDAVSFARQRGILCQGRGSAANSAVAYCLGITAVDPVKHGLLFERFLSEVRTDGRTEAPDIDVDFEMHRREEVLDYMYSRYGRSHAAITAVTQEYHAPSALQDVMRALGYPAQVAFALSKRMRGQSPARGAKLLEEGLAATVGLDLAGPRGKALLAALRALDGVPRLRSTHPGGFVLSSEPLGEFMPIEETTMGRTILQFDKDDLDAAGVPKFDFLGLGGLSAVHLAFDAIEKRTGERLELYRLPTDDPKTFEMIAAGDTVGTFQIESRAQIQSILQTRPERLYDLVVQVALIRPGPIQAKFVRPYTRRRRGLEPVTYAHPLLEPILRRTYGIPIFQEQAMAISMALGGFSAAEADELRRAMGHYRKIAKLEAVLERLGLRIAERTGLSAEAAAGIVDDLRSFANYGFPESHAWSFALIAYATAYLKAHFPAEFYLGLLNAWPMGFYPPATLVHDARRHGVTVLGPCLKEGEWDCTVEVLADDAEGRDPTDSRPVGAARAILWSDAESRGEAPESSASTRTPPAGAAPGIQRSEAERNPGAKRRNPAPQARNPAKRNPAAQRAAESSEAESGCSHGIGCRQEDSPDPGTALDESSAPGPDLPEKPDSDCAPLRSAGFRRGAPGFRALRALDSAPLRGAGGEEGPSDPVALRSAGGRPAVSRPAAVGGGDGAGRGAESRGVPALRIGWRHIRGLGERARLALQAARAEGPFTSIEDVVRRAGLSRAEALHLARAGAFEAFEPGRRRAAWEALRAAGDDLPLAPAHRLPFDPRELEGDELIFLDYLATGISVRGHPMEHVRPRLEAAGALSSRELEGTVDGERVVVAGLVVARQHPETAKGTVFVLMEDEFGFLNVIVPARTYARNREVVKFAPFLVVEGVVEREERVINVVGRRFRNLDTRAIAFRSRDFH